MNITNSTAHNSPTTVPPMIAARIDISNKLMTTRDVLYESKIQSLINLLTADVRR